MGCADSRDNKNKRKIYVVKHGQTQYNIAEDAVKEKDAKLAIKVDPDLMDCWISKEGQQEAQAAAKELAKTRIHHVFVSPLRSALQTAQVIFKDHMNKPKLIADPSLSEGLLVVCDIGDSLVELKRDFPDVDFHLIEEKARPHLWFLDHVPDQSALNEFEQKLSQFNGNQDNEARFARTFILDLMKAKIAKAKTGQDPETVESAFDLSKRANTAKTKLVERLSGISSDDGVCVVGHPVFLRAFTATSFDESGFPIDGLQKPQVLEFWV